MMKVIIFMKNINNNKYILPAYLSRYYDAYKEEFDLSIKEVLNSNTFILGNKVSIFESEYAKFCGSNFAVGVSDGTRALELSLRIIKQKYNQELIIFVPVMTAIATAMAAINVCNKENLILIDVDKNNFNMSLHNLKTQFLDKKNKIKKNKFKFVCIFVALYGSLKGIEEISKFCKDNNIEIIIDSAQSHGAISAEKKLKSMSFTDYATFSFYPTKNLPAFGDGGAICLNNKEDYNLCLQLREYGWLPGKRNYSHIIGFNSRLDEIQAALLLVGLKYLNHRNEIRKKIATIYHSFFGCLQARSSHYAYGCVFHQYVIETNNRDKFIEEAKKENILLGIHYPFHIGQNPPFKSGTNFEADNLTSRIVSLPISPEMNEDEIQLTQAKLQKSYEKLN